MPLKPKLETPIFLDWGGLRLHVRQAQMAPSVLVRFAHELDLVAQVDGQGFDPDEATLIHRVTGELVDVPMALFDSLWRHAELFLSGCLFVAVSDGRYSVEQARYISQLASRLGWSAAQLAGIEAAVLEQLEQRGRARLEQRG